MPRKSFTLEEIDKLIRLKVVTKVTPSTITYTSEFKVKIAECKTLTNARDLMSENQVPLDIIGERRFETEKW